MAIKEENIWKYVTGIVYFGREIFISPACPNILCVTLQLLREICLWFEVLFTYHNQIVGADSICGWHTQSCAHESSSQIIFNACVAMQRIHRQSVPYIWVVESPEASSKRMRVIHTKMTYAWTDTGMCTQQNVWRAPSLANAQFHPLAKTGTLKGTNT